MSNRSLSRLGRQVALAGLALCIAQSSASATLFPKGIKVDFVGIIANDIAVNRATKEVYATIPSSAGVPYGNSVVTIDASTASVIDHRFAGSEPNRITVSKNGAKAYIGIDGARAFRSWTPGTSNFGALQPLTVYNNDTAIAEDLAVAPDDPGVVIVSKDEVGSSGDGILQAFRGSTSSTDLTRTYDAHSIDFVNPTTLVSFNNSTTGFDLDRWSFDSENLTLTRQDSVRGLVSGFGTRIEVADNVIYGTSGVAVDPFTLTGLGTYLTGLSGQTVEAVPDLDVVLFAGTDRTSGGTATLKTFDRDTFLLLDTFDLGFNNGSFGSILELEHISGSQFAFLTGNGGVGIISAVPLPAPILLLGSAWGLLVLRRQLKG